MQFKFFKINKFYYFLPRFKWNLLVFVYQNKKIKYEKVEGFLNKVVSYEVYWGL